MANSFKQYMIIPISTAVEAAAADIFTFKVKHPMRVTDFGFVNTELSDMDTTLAQTSLDATIGTAARAEKAVLVYTDAMAVGDGKVASADDAAFVPFEIDAGDTLHFEHKVQGADPATVAGAYYPYIIYESIPDGQH